MAYILPETELLKINEVSRDGYSAQFEIEPLSPGYGVTIANSLRRILIASLPGAAVTSVRIEGATHEFASLEGVNEDVVEIILNLKSLNLKVQSETPIILTLDKKGPGVVTAADFKANADVEIMNPDLVIATLDKKGKLALEITCERGRGYVTTEMRREEKLPLGTIAIDSIFTPIKKVHYQVDNTRVGRMTNFDKVTLDIATDGSLEPTQALQMAASILIEHLAVIAGQDSPAERQTESESVATVETVEIESEAIVVKPKRSRKTEVSDVSA